MTNAKIISDFIADQLYVVARRGFATATRGGVSGGARVSGIAMVKKGGESKNSIPWVPDPVTGYYRSEDQSEQVDTAELRELLLKHRNRRHN
ncbi:late embryogenis abundant protein 2-like [Bidens hawaiensis]|uniref:late embryogenis abundant protein 2-like n=1 Tax=Bidens hawaiensis TaxID=980011 RepID=UPI00404B9A7E